MLRQSEAGEYLAASLRAFITVVSKLNEKTVRKRTQRQKWQSTYRQVSPPLKKLKISYLRFRRFPWKPPTHCEYYRRGRTQRQGSIKRAVNVKCFDSQT